MRDPDVLETHDSDLLQLLGTELHHWRMLCGVYRTALWTDDPEEGTCAQCVAIVQGSLAVNVAE